MLIQVNTDRNIDGDETLSREVEAVVGDALDPFSDRITRVEVHLSDENSDKKSGAADIRCVLEMRIEGLRPIAVSHDAETAREAVMGAAQRARRSVDSTLAKLRER